MTAYYNEIEPFAAQWLRELISAGMIAPGDVDERSIEDVRPAELMGYAQCHFFAGIGVWQYALRAAGWPDDRPVWTGSCPCQPFSQAGKGAAFDDERHLWPSFQWLIQQCQPPIVFGEQVASKSTGPWIDLVHADLEGMGYAFGCVPFPAAGVGAPHIRDRAYWVAHAVSERWQRGRASQTSNGRDTARIESERFCDARRMAYATGTGLQRGGLEGSTRPGRKGCAVERSGTNGFWSACDWLPCRDGKYRPVEPGTFPLANGATARVGRLRGFGNAIVAPQAQVFIESVMDWRL